MMSIDRDDAVLSRVRSADPVDESLLEAGDHDATRETVRARARSLASDEDGPRSRLTRLRGPYRLVLGTLGVGAFVLAGLVLLGGGGSTGPTRALAIERTDRWITLKITDPGASQTQMNDELAAAGIDGVRVLAVPDSTAQVGTWAGYITVGRVCGTPPAPTSPSAQAPVDGMDITFPNQAPYGADPSVDNREPFALDRSLPRDTGALRFGYVTQPYARDEVRVRPAAVTDLTYSPKVLVFIGSARADGGGQRATVALGDIGSLGGVFAEYASALGDGVTTCEELGLPPSSYRDVTEQGPPSR